MQQQPCTSWCFSFDIQDMGIKVLYLLCSFLETTYEISWLNTHTIKCIARKRTSSNNIFHIDPLIILCAKPNNPHTDSLIHFSNNNTKQNHWANWGCSMDEQGRKSGNLPRQQRSAPTDKPKGLRDSTRRPQRSKPINLEFPSWSSWIVFCWWDARQHLILFMAVPSQGSSCSHIFFLLRKWIPVASGLVWLPHYTIELSWYSSSSNEGKKSSPRSSPLQFSSKLSVYNK